MQSAPEKVGAHYASSAPTTHWRRPFAGGPTHLAAATRRRPGLKWGSGPCCALGARNRGADVGGRLHSVVGAGESWRPLRIGGAHSATGAPHTHHRRSLPKAR